MNNTGSCLPVYEMKLPKRQNRTMSGAGIKVKTHDPRVPSPTPLGHGHFLSTWHCLVLLFWCAIALRFSRRNKCYLHCINSVISTLAESRGERSWNKSWGKYCSISLSFSLSLYLSISPAVTIPQNVAVWWHCWGNANYGVITTL